MILPYCKLKCQPKIDVEGFLHTFEIMCYKLPLSLPVAVPAVKVIGTLISLLLTIPPDIITVADITPDDSDPLNVDDPNVIIATVQ